MLKSLMTKRMKGLKSSELGRDFLLFCVFSVLQALLSLDEVRAPSGGYSRRAASEDLEGVALTAVVDHGNLTIHIQDYESGHACMRMGPEREAEIQVQLDGPVCRAGSR